MCEVIYKDDMLIQTAASGLSCGEVFYVTFAIMLMLATYSSVPVALYLRDEHYYLIAISGLVYWLYSCCHNSTSYIFNSTALKQVYKNVEAAIKSAP